MDDHAKWIVGKGGKRADLRGAVLRGADLRWADLRGAVLRGADLCGADLRGADLLGADLSDAVMLGAVLHGADLRGAQNIPELISAQLEILPRTGAVMGWKKCKQNVIVEIEVLPDSPRSNATGRKCRAESVRVVAVHGGDYGVSRHDNKTVYRVGEVVKCDKWNPDRWAECGGGIHFFLTREEAEAY